MNFFAGNQGMDSQGFGGWHTPGRGTNGKSLILQEIRGIIEKHLLQIGDKRDTASFRSAIFIISGKRIIR